MLEFCWTLSQCHKGKIEKGVREITALLLKQWIRCIIRRCTPLPKQQLTIIDLICQLVELAGGTTADAIYWQCENKQTNNPYTLSNELLEWIFVWSEKVQTAWRMATWNELVQKALHSSISFSFKACSCLPSSAAVHLWSSSILLN